MLDSVAVRVTRGVRLGAGVTAGEVGDGRGSNTMGARYSSPASMPMRIATTNARPRGVERGPWRLGRAGMPVGALVAAELFGGVMIGDGEGGRPGWPDGREGADAAPGPAVRKVDGRKDDAALRPVARSMAPPDRVAS